MAPTAVLDGPDDVPNAKSVNGQGANTLTVNGILPTPLPNPCLVTTADHELKQVEYPVHEPKAGEVLLHIKATGVCG